MKKKGSSVIVLSAHATLKKHLRRHLTSLGFQKGPDGALTPLGTGKDSIRTIHSAQRDDRLSANRSFILERSPDG